ncbi:Multidrug efflux pump accessory protein AcrZ [Xenorhabdus mauleonii]|uniref:Multidrug efflux pump accessory protein AcrZ n=1 Tax=Xenorhabdus mauleonii TaxID=351675 RepID=A0A1I3ICJ2_9GAMM|nr:AcrZ family multidrug efflux pump-associated protein [Xenorhabdus mauleonii]PHM39443.1 Multidrug efflux pump accessory protein AcrZ [Xenorhabdus mauleonii]SFI45661.1 Multidrug efflux pump-associated protein AcrZ [Xenorhabdus mauleonii]
MLELITSMGFALIMVPVVMAAILTLIYGLGGVFNFISKAGNTERQS